MRMDESSWKKLLLLVQVQQMVALFTPHVDIKTVSQWPMTFNFCTLNTPPPPLQKKKKKNNLHDMDIGLVW